MAKFVIKKISENNFQFHLETDDGQILLNSDCHNSRADCEKTIQSIRKNAEGNAHYDRKLSTKGSFFFQLRDYQGQTVGISTLYDNYLSRENGIRSVKMTAPTATVEY